MLHAPSILLMSVGIGISTVASAKLTDNLHIDELSVNAAANQPVAVKDPFEAINRSVFRFNLYLDDHFLLPTARVYQHIVPTPINNGVGTFFYNLREPWTAINLLLQGNPKASLKSFGRFTINTLTTLGFADPAAVTLNWPRPSEDFGQTLGVWGVKSGPFLMLPFFGPSTLRDTGAMVADRYGMPQRYVVNTAWDIGLVGLRVVDKRADLIGVEDIIQGDQYSLLRDVYLQRRQFEIDPTQAQQQAPAMDDSFGDETDESTSEPIPPTENTAATPSF